MKQVTQHFIIKIGLQMTRVLESFHSKGFIHCDIKPNNILISKEDNFACNGFKRVPKNLILIDFGLSETQGISEME